jgi:hypothetical protein
MNANSTGWSFSVTSTRRPESARRRLNSPLTRNRQSSPEKTPPRTSQNTGFSLRGGRVVGCE